jgi:hypothetical protein
MIKALTAIATAAAIAAAITFSPGLAPEVEAGVPQAVAKSDRVEIPVQTTVQAPATDSSCASQSWPHIDAACLRNGTNAAIQPARLVTTDRR